MHLLKLADENEAPGADDFTPVLVFVLIKASLNHKRVREEAEFFLPLGRTRGIVIIMSII